jgi:tryptophan-rich sensory protein
MDNYCIGSLFCFNTFSSADIVIKIISIIIIFLPLIIGTTIGAIYGKKWGDYKYKNLKKPTYNPPSYLFGIIWPILYLFIGIIYSFALYDEKCIPNKISSCGTIVYYKNFVYWIIPILALVFNFLYIPLFFGENGLFNGLIIILFSLLFAILTLIQFCVQDNYNSNIKYYAILTLLPYIIWLSFASYLSYDIYMMNR